MITFDLQTNNFKKQTGTVTKDTTVKRLGDFSYRIDLPAGATSNDESKKSELIGLIGNDGAEIFERDGNTSYYAFSFMVAEDWVSPVGHAGQPNHATILQFKTPSMPVIAVMIFGEEVVLKLNTTDRMYFITDLKRGEWQDFYFGIVFSKTNGSINVWSPTTIELLDTGLLPTATADDMELHTGDYTPQDEVDRTIWIGALTRSDSFEDIFKPIEVPAPAPEMLIGIYPEDYQTKYDIPVGRRVITSSSFVGNRQPYTDTILLNFNNNWSHTYTTRPETFGQHAKDAYDHLQPELLVIENEELIKDGVIRSAFEIELYLNELKAASMALPYKCTNGGLVLPQLSYWYFNETNDHDFFIKNIPTNQKQGLIDGLQAETIHKVQIELDVVKGLQIAYLNLHFYFGLANQADGLIRMFNYLSQYMGDQFQLMSNEAGCYHDIALLKECVRIARETKMKYLILYSGKAPQPAMTITKDDFNNAIQ